MDLDQARCLVLSRAGAKHKLHQLLMVPRQQRSWDLAISHYDELPESQTREVDFLHAYKGGKWDGVYQFFQDHPETIANYEYFWLVDDDIETSAKDVDTLFSTMVSEGFQLAQPALSHDSYHSYLITVACSKFQFRYTNFVELMMPVLSREVLIKALPLFKGNRSGRGIDWVWYLFTENWHKNVAIIDAVTVAHRRPLRVHLHSRMREEGVCPDSEKAINTAHLQTARFAPMAIAGRLQQDGGLVTGRWRMLYHMGSFYLSVRRKLTATPANLSFFFELLVGQAFFGRKHPRIS